MNHAIASCISIFKIIIRTKFNLKLPKAAAESCIILGNGPSLKQSLEKDLEMFKKSTLMCVNNFASSAEFTLLKPSYYVLLDPGFFIDKQRKDIVETFDILKNNVDWELTLFIPYIFRKDIDVNYLTNKRGKVKVNFYNYVVFKGFKSLGFKLFKNNFAMPKFYNVLGASIFLAINMGFKKIKITGADHSWFENIKINENNLLCRRDLHFYDIGEQPLIPIHDPVSRKTLRIGDFFEALHKTFDTYYLLNQYAATKSCIVYNISEFSYIDAFKRTEE
jgi:hypothetical protein